VGEPLYCSHDPRRSRRCLLTMARPVGVCSLEAGPDRSRRTEASGAAKGTPEEIQGVISEDERLRKRSLRRVATRSYSDDQGPEGIPAIARSCLQLPGTRLSTHSGDVHWLAQLSLRRVRLLCRCFPSAVSRIPRVPTPWLES